MHQTHHPFSQECNRHNPLKSQEWTTLELCMFEALELKERSTYVCLLEQQPEDIHFEVVKDLTFEVFLLAFSRFASCKSLPSKLISDNASAFVSVNNELKELVQSHVLKETIAREGIEWQLITKKAPWYHGFWERLIGLTKSTFKKVLGRAAVNACTLQTINYCC